MRWRLIAIISLLTWAPVAAQNADTTLDDLTAAVLRLPVWSPPISGPATAAHFDTLRLDLTLQERPGLRQIRHRRLISAGLVILGGALSRYYQLEADKAFAAYQRSGDTDRLERLYRESRQLDRYAGWSYVAAEAGLVALSVSFILHP